MRILAIMILLLDLGGTLRAASADEQFEKILSHYFRIHARLADDSTRGVDVHAREIVFLCPAESGDARLDGPFADVRRAAREMYRPFLTISVDALEKNVVDEHLEETRIRFHELSKPLLIYLRGHYSGSKRVHNYFCPVAGKGWFQLKGVPRNPYLHCDDHRAAD